MSWTGAALAGLAVARSGPERKPVARQGQRPRAVRLENGIGSAPHDPACGVCPDATQGSPRRPPARGPGCRRHAPPPAADRSAALTDRPKGEALASIPAACPAGPCGWPARPRIVGHSRLWRWRLPARIHARLWRGGARAAAISVLSARHARGTAPARRCASAGQAAHPPMRLPWTRGGRRAARSARDPRCRPGRSAPRWRSHWSAPIAPPPGSPRRCQLERGKIRVTWPIFRPGRISALP